MAARGKVKNRTFPRSIAERRTGGSHQKELEGRETCVRSRSFIFGTFGCIVIWSSDNHGVLVDSFRGAAMSCSAGAKMVVSFFFG